MFWVWILILCVMLFECFDLFRRKMNLSFLRMGLATLVVTIINFWVLIPSFNVPYSSTLYLLNFLSDSMVLGFLWVFVNFFFFGFVFILMYKLMLKKRQSRKIFVLFSLLGFVDIVLFIFLIFHSISAWLLLILFIWIIVFLVRRFLRSKANYLLVFIVLFLSVTYYSFFTYKGACKLQIALMGYPFSAIDTNLEELVHISDKNSKSFYPIKNIAVESGEMGVILVRNYFGIKIAKYVGF